MPSAFGGLLRSTVVFGAAQLVQVGLSLIRMKVVALLLGPTGVGLLGVYINLQGTAVTAGGLGMASSGVRAIARTKDDGEELARVRVVLLGAHLVQGTIAALVLVALQHQLAVWLVGDAGFAADIVLVAAAVFLAMLASSQATLLQGLRRTGDLALVTIISSVIATIAAVSAVLLWGQAGLAMFVVVQPAAAVLVTLFFVGRLPRIAWRVDLASVLRHWRDLASVGVPFMVAGLTSTAALLAVRAIVVHDLGLDAAGQLAASWGIAIQYIGLLMAAMSTDYYPRLAEIHDDREAASGLMNDQLQLALAIGGPALLLLLALAPWAMTLIYAHGFDTAARLLQWQCVGNIMRLASWPLSFALVAGARSRLYLLVELVWSALFLGLVWIGLPLIGIEAAGPAFALTYLGYCGLLVAILHRLHLFSWHALSAKLLGVQFGLAIAILICAYVSAVLAAVCGVAAALVAGLLSVRIVLANVWPTSGPGRLLLAGFARIGWPVERRA